MQNGQSNRFSLIEKIILDQLVVNSVTIDFALPQNVFEAKKATCNYRLDFITEPNNGAPMMAMATANGSVNGSFEVEYNEFRGLKVSEIPAFVLTSTLNKIGAELKPIS